jgi:acetyl-CoA acetyltransferase
MTGTPAIVGMGMTRFGKYPDTSLKTLGGEAIERALADAGLEAADIDMAFVANAMASVVTGQVSVVGQTILRAAGFSGIPVYNVDNACAGSSSALNLAVHAVRSGAAETVLVVGAEKLVSADRTAAYRALNGAADVDFVAASGIDPTRESVFVAAVYPERLRAYAEVHPLSAETLARISVKNRRHASLNPMAQYTDPMTVEDVLASRVIVDPVHALMCAPIGDGASAVIVTRAGRVRGTQRPVWIRGSAVGMAAAAGEESTIRRVSARAYQEAGITPADIDVAEVHDSIAFNELLAYEELGFCEPGGGSRLVEEGATSLGGRIPVNTSGGLESRGHPVAATGLAQIVELGLQLRGEAGERQVADPRYALAENAGGFAGGDTAAVVITVLSNVPAEA